MPMTKWASRLPTSRQLAFRLLASRLLSSRLPTSRQLVGLLLLCLGILVDVPVARAGFDVTDVPPFPSTSRPRFQVNAANYLGEMGAPEVVLAFRIPYSELFFAEKTDTFGATYYEAEFDLIMLLSDGKRQVGGDLWNEVIRVESEAETESRKRWHRRIVRIPAEKGRLTAEVSIHERESGRASGTSWEIDVPDYEDERISLSSLWVVDCEKDGDSDEFPPRSWLLESRFGEPLGSICVRGEVYRNDLPGPVSLRWRVLDARQEKVHEDRLSFDGGERVPFRFQPNLQDLWLGNYLLEVEVEAGGKKAKRKFAFQMDETTVSLTNDMEQSLDLVRLIATKAEINALEDAPEEARAEAWTKFWDERDPTPGTPDNEFKNSFFQRVRYANENYGVLEPGWRSDRGRIYIKYGQPEQVESRPSRVDGLAVEVWTYIDLGLRFVFVDYDGFGRYELYQPGRS
ncbi:MAG: GWxTD domain-containing protein [Candidatus Eisenbacteria bacterium]|nr:GWxTD domain-containing protein [Candidatus Eisenbacteria bacterium]